MRRVTMPTPKQGESRKAFVARCIPFVLEEGTASTPQQAAAICNSLYNRAKGDTEKNAKYSFTNDLDIESILTGGTIFQKP